MLLPGGMQPGTHPPCMHTVMQNVAPASTPAAGMVAGECFAYDYFLQASQAAHQCKDTPIKPGRAKRLPQLGHTGVCPLLLVPTPFFPPVPAEPLTVLLHREVRGLPRLWAVGQRERQPSAAAVLREGAPAQGGRFLRPFAVAAPQSMPSCQACPAGCSPGAATKPGSSLLCQPG